MIVIQKLTLATATAVPTWMDTRYKTLTEARKGEPNELKSWFRRKDITERPKRLSDVDRVRGSEPIVRHAIGCKCATCSGRRFDV